MNKHRFVRRYAVVDLIKDSKGEKIKAKKIKSQRNTRNSTKFEGQFPTYILRAHTHTHIRRKRKNFGRIIVVIICQAVNIVKLLHDGSKRSGDTKRVQKLEELEEHAD